MLSLMKTGNALITMTLYGKNNFSTYQENNVTSEKLMENPHLDSI